MKAHLHVLALVCCLSFSGARLHAAPFSPPASSKKSGPGGGNGGFTGENAQIILDLAISSLAKQLPHLSDSELTPENRRIAMKALANIIPMKNVDSELMFDYPRIENPPAEIYVYKSFFIAYDQAATDQTKAMYVPAVEERLLREISHLWKLDDPEAVVFAKRVLNKKSSATSSRDAAVKDDSTCKLYYLSFSRNLADLQKSSAKFVNSTSAKYTKRIIDILRAKNLELVATLEDAEIEVTEASSQRQNGMNLYHYETFLTFTFKDGSSEVYKGNDDPIPFVAAFKPASRENALEKALSQVPNCQK